jgi:GT2 family glycosyltransferase
MPAVTNGTVRVSTGSRPAPLLSVVVVTHDVKDLLAGCLRSVYASVTPFDFEVCVVDSGADGSASMVRRDFPAAAVIEAPDNPGFAAANNLGLRQARGGYCLLLNPDTVVPSGALAETVAAMEAEPALGIPASASTT